MGFRIYYLTHTNCFCPKTFIVLKANIQIAFTISIRTNRTEYYVRFVR